jgi:hypothetical protein
MPEGPLASGPSMEDPVEKAIDWGSVAEYAGFSGESPSAGVG